MSNSRRPLDVDLHDYENGLDVNSGSWKMGVRVTEDDARLSLLQTELNGIQGAIRGLDQILFQIKGWCVTVSLAIGGVAIAYHRPSLLIVGFVAVVGFFLINCQFGTVQRAFIQRNFDLDHELKTVGVLQVLRGKGNFDIVGTAAAMVHIGNLDYGAQLRYGLPRLWREATGPATFSLYAFILVCLAVEAIVLW
jgi:hypothetical protein